MPKSRYFRYFSGGGVINWLSIHYRIAIYFETQDFGLIETKRDLGGEMGWIGEINGGFF